jgi:hypothetical protein
MTGMDEIKAGSEDSPVSVRRPMLLKGGVAVSRSNVF